MIKLQRTKKQEILGGAGGGNQRFAQGGGKDKSKKNDAIEKVKSMVLEV